MPKTAKKDLQNTLRYNLGQDLVVVNRKIDSLAAWMAAYFQFEVTTQAREGDKFYPSCCSPYIMVAQTTQNRKS